MSIYRLCLRARRSRRHFLIPLLPLALCALVAGCGGGGDGDRGGADSNPPQVVWALFDPSTISATGGTARIQAQVTDSSAIAWVRATLTAPDGVQTVLEMTWQSGGYYQASFDVPANLGGDSLQYSATISACDGSGNVTSPASVGHLTVGGDTGPPPPPSL